MVAKKKLPNKPKRKASSLKLPINKRLVFWLLGIGAFFGVTIGVNYVPWFTITELSIEGASVLSHDRIAQVVVRHLQQKVSGLYPRSSVLVFSHNDLQADIIEAVPDIHTASVQLDNTNKLVVMVTERDPAYRWCSQRPEDAETVYQKARLCHFVDRDGVLYAQAPYYSPGTYFTFTGNLSGLTDGQSILGQKITTRNKLELIQQLQKQLEPTQTDIIGYEPKSEFDAVYYIQKLGGVYVSPYTELRVAIDASNDYTSRLVQLALTDIEFTQKLQNEPRDLEYIDVRFDNKIAYKFFGDDSIVDPDQLDKGDNVDDANTAALQ